MVTDSRKVAEVFGKEHKHVLDSIRQILVVENSATKFFYETEHEYRGQKFPMYLMNHDGFSLLVMGFTGTKAIQWKLRYINAFNQMERQLKATPSYQIEDNIERAKAWIREEEERRKLLSTNKQQEQLIGELKPKRETTA